MLQANSVYKSLEKNLLFVIFLIIVVLALLWGWKTSGVLQSTMQWNPYPEGYSYIFHTPFLGDWPINKESKYYLDGACGFLNDHNFTLNVGSGYEIYRTFYSFLLRSFWFLNPMVAVLLLDIIVWFISVLSIRYVAKKMTQDSVWINATTLLALLGQGFMESVGEGMGHVLGYASGYLILGLVAYLEPWKENATWRTDLPIFAFIGLWQLAYGTAFFHLPIPIFASLYRLRHESITHQCKQIFPLLIIAVLPYLLVSIICGYFLKGNIGVLSIVLERIQGQHIDIGHFLYDYFIVFLDSLISLGPLALIGILGFLTRIVEKDKLCLGLFVILLIQFFGMTLLLIPLAGRGYATFNFSPLLCIGGGALFSTLYNKFKSKNLRLTVISSLVLLVILYPHAGKLGYRLPNQIFFTGFQNLFTTWHPYEHRLFS